MDGGAPLSSRSFEPLTRREREILGLLAQNYSDREIAERLFIALTTVKWFNRQIFSKMGVENRQEATQQAQLMGLLGARESTATFTQNLPAQLTPFIGRMNELAEVRHWLSHPHTRLVTILAPGGMGKTRLAVEVASNLLEDYADGVYFVPLAGLTSSDPIISTLIDTFGFQFSADGRSPQHQLFTALRRKQLLLVLDNFEQMLDSAPMVAELFEVAPFVKVLVTSRESLNISGETVYPLTGLAISASAAGTEGSQNDAAQLFIVCAQRANPHFLPADSQDIQRVCRLVQGMPLAIELAAAWSRTLSTADIAQEIERSADFLQTTMPNIPARLRSVRAVFEAAWVRLTEDAQQVFRRLSVFNGGCTRDAAQVVTGATPRVLALLVDHALLWRNVQTERYEVHELLRQYAEQALQTAGEAETIQAAHQRYYAQLTQTWTSALLADKMLEGLAVLDADMENIRVAFTQATYQAEPEAVAPFTDLWFYYDVRSRWVEGDRLFRAAREALEPDDSLALAKLLTGQAVFYERLWLSEPEYDVGKRAYEMALRLGARRDLPLAMIVYADALRDLGRHTEALPIYQDGLAIAREVDFPLTEAMFKFHLANDAALNRRWDEAETRMMEAYFEFSKLNNLWAMGFSKDRLAMFAHYAGEIEKAQQHYTDMLEIARTTHFDYQIDIALLGLSDVARERGDWQTVYHLNLEILRLRYDIAPNDRMLVVLASLAEATWMLNDLSQSRRRVAEAVRLLREWEVAERHVWRLLSEAFLQLLYTAAGLLMQAEDFVRALALMSFAEVLLPRCEPKSLVVKRFVQLLPMLLAPCRDALTTDDFAAAQARGKTLSFDTILAELSVLR